VAHFFRGTVYVIPIEYKYNSRK